METHSVTEEFMNKWTKQMRRALMLRERTRVLGLLGEVNEDTTCGEYRVPLLHYLVERNEKRIVWLLIRSGLSVNRKDGFGTLALDLAVRRNRRSMARMLVTGGAVLDNEYYRNRYGPLHLAAESSTPMVEMLLRAGCSVHGKDDALFTPLHYVALSPLGCDINRAKLLVNAGSNVNAVDRAGRTSLHYAANCVKYEMIRYLLERGATANAYDNTGCNTLGYCFNERGCYIMEYQRSSVNKRRDIFRCADLLIEHGAEVNTPLPGRSALMAVLTNVVNTDDMQVHSVAYVRYLLMRGATFDCENEIVRSAMGGKDQIAKLLLRHVALCNTSSWRAERPANFSRDGLNGNWRDFYRRCEVNLARMQDTRIHNNFTFLNLLCDESSRQWVMLDAVVDAFRRRLAGGEFNVYKDLLVRRFYEMRKEQRLRKKAVKGLSRVSSMSPIAFPHIFDRILKYLTEKDLRALALVV